MITLLRLSELLNNFFLSIEELYPNQIGYMYMILANFVFSWHNYLVGITNRIPSSQVFYWQNVVMLIMTYSIIKKHDRPFFSDLNKNNKLLILQGTLGFLAGAFVFYGFQNVPLNEAIVIFQTNPAIVGILSFIFLREPYDFNQFVITILNMAGVIFIAKPAIFFGNYHEGSVNEATRLGGIFALLAAAFFIAASNTTIKAVVSHVDPVLVNYYCALMSTLWNGPLMFYQEIVIPNFREFINMFFVGGSAVTAIYLWNRAYLHGNAGKISLMGYSQIVFGYFFEIVLVKGSPDSYSTFGSGLIMACAVFQFYQTREGTKIIITVH